MNQGEILNQCKETIELGRSCRLQLGVKAIQSETFKQWVEDLYETYSAKQISQQLQVSVPRDENMQAQVQTLFQVAALKQQLKRSVQPSMKSN